MITNAKDARENSFNLFMDMIYRRIKSSYTFNEKFYIADSPGLRKRVCTKLLDDGYSITLDKVEGSITVKW